jgi:hypothetical protein
MNLALVLLGIVGLVLVVALVYIVRSWLVNGKRRPAQSTTPPPVEETPSRTRDTSSAERASLNSRERDE